MISAAFSAEGGCAGPSVSHAHFQTPNTQTGTYFGDKL